MLVHNVDYKYYDVIAIPSVILLFVCSQNAVQYILEILFSSCIRNFKDNFHGTCNFSVSELKI